MKLIVNKDRSVIPVGTWGTKNENDFEIVDFEFPEELEGYNKRIVYLLGGGDNPWGIIRDNKAYITSEITSKENVKGYVWCTKENRDRPADTDFRSREFDIPFYENENATGVVPTPQQVDGFNEMLTEMNAKIDEVDALETTIGAAESTRQSNETTRQTNEQTRQTNEATRQENEQTRQSQEAERERRTDEAIGNIEDKTAEYNTNAEAKTNAFNQNATQKTNEFNSNYTQKVNDFNTNASSKESAFNSNASSKTSAFNSNAETKTNAFNTNATNKTNDFNSNATEKTTTFNNNASTKTTEFNTNAESKTSAFNDNATQKTTNFDNNASEKTDEFNTNAQEKIDEYDEHIVEYQAQIDELQEEVDELSENMPWNTTEQATEISVDDAAKYSRNRMKILGNTEQQSYSGKNLFPGWNEGQINASTGEDIVAVNQYRSDYIEISINTDYYFSVEQLSSYYNYNFKIFKYDEEKSYLGMQSFGTGYTFRGVINITEADVRYIRIAETQTLDKLVNTQLEIGTARTTYEPYVGGQPSPNPDYPQDIHVVTGENTIEQYSKNLLYFPYSTYNWSGTSYINGSKIVIEGSAAISTSVRVASKYNINIPRNTTVTFSARIVEGKEFFKKNWAQFGCNLYYDDGSKERFDVAFHNTSYIDSIRFVTITILKKVVAIAPVWGASSIGESGKFITFGIQMEIGSNVTEYMDGKAVENYPIDLGSLELCKIGDYQDYLYKENGNWYKHGAIGKVVFNGTQRIEAMNTSSTNTARLLYKGIASRFNDGGICNQLRITGLSTWDSDIEGLYQEAWNDNFYFRINKSTIGTTTNEANAYLANNNLIFYGSLKVPTITQITDSTLIAQLDAIYEHLQLVKGTNNITVTAEDLAPYMKLSYMQDLPSKLDNLDSRLALLE